MMHTRRVPGRIAGWVCLLATLLHALAFVAHSGRAVASPSPSGLVAALAGALCTGGDVLEAHAPPGGDDENRPALSGCPVCTAGVSILALPAPSAFKIADRRILTAPARPAGRSGFEPAGDQEATPIRGPPPTGAIT